MSPESAATQASSVAFHQDMHQKAPNDSDAYMRWRLAWEKQWAREDSSIQELDQKIAALKKNMPGRRNGSRSRSRSPCHSKSGPGS